MKIKTNKEEIQAAIATVTGLKPDIRWPNDLLVSEKKCGGILGI